MKRSTIPVSCVPSRRKIITLRCWVSVLPQARSVLPPPAAPLLSLLSAWDSLVRVCGPGCGCLIGRRRFFFAQQQEQPFLGYAVVIALAAARRTAIRPRRDRLHRCLASSCCGPPARRA